MTPVGLPFPDPPTRDTLSSARVLLQSKRRSILALSDKIQKAEEALAQLIAESRCAIAELEAERQMLKREEAAALGYLSPVRRLPAELVREIFRWCWEEHPCCAWVLSAVCRSWRREALRMPKIWSKIRLLTTPSASADTIRLWIERSGDSVPLDIEIVLHVGHPTPRNASSDPYANTVFGDRRASVTEGYYPTTSASSSNPGSGPAPGWSTSLASTFSPASHSPAQTMGNAHAQSHQPHHHFQNTSPSSSQQHSPDRRAAGPNSSPRSPSDPRESESARRRESHRRRITDMQQHWGHVAFYYLVEQMHRWERFVFRFDRQFVSMGALKSINGDAPLLKEFEVSSAEAGFYVEWPWLPNTPSEPPPFPSSSPYTLPTAPTPSLRSVVLQHTPFTHCSPMLRDLTQLTLRATPTSHFPLDRIRGILSASPGLERVSMHFQGVLPPVLPMDNGPATTVFLPGSTTNAAGTGANMTLNVSSGQLVLAELKDLRIGGHYLLTRLVDALTTPSLASLTLDIESRDPIEDTISGLLDRSGKPGIRHLSVGYGAMSTASVFNGRGGWDDESDDAPSSASGAAVGGMAFGAVSGSSAGGGAGGAGGVGPGNAAFYYGPAGTVVSWALLQDLPELKSLDVGGTPMDGLLAALGPPEDDPAALGGGGGAGEWACRNLESLRMRGCHSHGEGVGRLVALVEARNPAGGSVSSNGANGGSWTGGAGGGIKRMRRIEMVDCASVGGDVVRWLRGRVQRVCVVGGEPTGAVTR